MKRLRKLKGNEVIAIIGLILALLFSTRAFAVSWYIPAVLPDTAYTAKWVLFYEDSTIADSSVTDSNSVGFDTVLSISEDSVYICVVQIVWDSGGPAASWEFRRTGHSILVDSIAGRGFSTGTGTNNVRIYTIDTVAGDSIAGVTITINQMGGAQEASSPAPGTNSFGYADFTLPADSFEITAHLTGYFWRTDTIEVTGADTVDINGASIWGSPAPPTASNVSRVWGFAYDLQELAVSCATVDFWIKESDIQDTCADVPILPLSVHTETNDTGYYQADLLFSDCMDKPRTEWQIKIEYSNELGEVVATKSHSFRIPADSVTYRLTF